MIFRIIGGSFRWLIAGLTAWYKDGDLRGQAERAEKWSPRDRIERYWSVVFYALLLVWGSSVDLALPWVEDPFWARALGVVVLTVGGVFVSVITARRIVVAVTHDPWTAQEMWTDKLHLMAILLVVVTTPVAIFDRTLPVPSEWVVAGFPLITGAISGVWASSVILVDHRSKRTLLSAVRAAFGGSEAEWARSRFVARGKVVTVRHAPAAAFSDLRASEQKLSQVAPDWQIDDNPERTSASGARLTLVRTTTETRASREVIARSEGLVIGVSDHHHPGAVRYALAPGTTPSQYPRVDALAKADGLRVTEWNPAGGFAIAAPLDADVATARDVIAESLKCHPYEIALEVTRNEEGSFATVNVTRVPLVALDAEKRAETWRLITRLLPYGTTGWLVEDAGSSVTLTWGAARVLPELVPGAGFIPAEISPDLWNKLPIGIDALGNVASLDLQAGPHSLVVGPTGSGKSVSTRLVIVSALARGFDVIYVDPVKRGAGLRDMEPWTRGMFTASAAEAAEVLTAVYAEVTRRVDMIEDALVEDWRSLEGVRPILVVLDEFAGLVLADKARPIDKFSTEYAEWEEREGAKAKVIEKVSKIAAEARSAGCFLLLSTQRPDVEYIPGAARSNMGSIVQLAAPIKAPSRTALQMVFDADEIADAQRELSDLHGSRHGFALVSNEGGGIRGIRVGFLNAGEAAPILEALEVPLGEPIIPKHVRRRGTDVEEVADPFVDPFADDEVDHFGDNEPAQKPFAADDDPFADHPVGEEVAFDLDAIEAESAPDAPLDGLVTE